MNKDEKIFMFMVYAMCGTLVLWLILATVRMIMLMFE